MDPRIKTAAAIFCDAFLGSLATILAGVAVDALPNMRILAQMLLAACIAGVVAAIGYVRHVLVGE